MMKLRPFMKVNMLIVSMLAIICSLSSFSLAMGAKVQPEAVDEPTWQQNLDDINEKITILKKWQEGYRLTAEQAQFKADRLQFEQDNLIDAKRLWKVAENANQKADDLQVIIAKLETQRNDILRKHNLPIPKK